MDLTKPATAHLVDVLCHCDADPAGHPLDHPGCAVVIRPGRYTRPEVTTGSHPIVSASATALGTCTGCDRPRTVKRVRRLGDVPRTNRSVLLAHAPLIAPHKVRGEQCPGSGRPPVEVRFVEGSEVASWAAVHGAGAVR